MFVQKLNPLTGEADWVLVNDPGLGDDDDASADLVATSSYLDMLTDCRRNAAYHAALRRVVPAKQRLAAEAKEGSVAGGAAAAVAGGINPFGIAAGTSPSAGVRVLDIGTGTGLLAMMAARLLPPCEAGSAAGGEDAAAAAEAAPAAAAAEEGAAAAAGATPPPVDAPPSAPVLACEVFPPMQNLARRVIASNGLADMIRVVNKRSDEIVVKAQAEAAAAAAAAAAKLGAMPPAAAARAARVAAAAGGKPAGPDMYGRADVIVTEIFDSELLGEGMIPTMRHAVQHLLKEGGVVIPATSRVYGQLVQCPLMHRMTGLRSGELSPLGEGALGGSGEGIGGGGGATTPPITTVDRVLAALGDLDARARGSFFSSEDLYEVREMHVDLLYQHGEAARRRLLTHGSRSAPERAPASHQPPPAPQAPAPQQGQQQGQAEACTLELQGGGEAGAVKEEAEEGGETASGPYSRHQLLLPLSDPFLVFDFDWLRPPPPSGRREVLQVPVTRDGHAHAVLLWWQLGMVPEQLQPSQPQQEQPGSPATEAGAPLLLSTAPVWLEGRPEAGGDGGPLGGVEQRWRDHWKQCWVQLADDEVAVRQGEALPLIFEHDDLNIRSKLVAPTPVSTAATAAAAAPPPPPPPVETPAPPATVDGGAATASLPGGPSATTAKSARDRLAALQAEADEEALSRQQLMPLLSWLGPLALLQLGDRARLSTFERALEAALQEAGAATAAGTAPAEGAAAASAGAEVVVVDGSLALGLLAASHPAVASVTLLQEDNLSAQLWLKASARRLGVPASKIKSVRSETYFKRLRAGAGAAGAGASPAVGPLVLVSEPYFSEFEQLVPWAHLKFWRDYDVIIRGSPAARGGRRVAAFPRRARLVAVAAALPELWRTRFALGRVEGLDLSAANAVLGVVGGEDEDSRGDGKAPGHSGGGAGPRADDDGDDEDGDVWGGDDGSGEDGSSGGGGGGRRQPLPILPYSVWQAGGGYEELSSREELLSLDCGGHLDDVESGATLTAARGSTCHAIVLWLEYDLGGEVEQSPPRGGEAGEASVGGATMSSLVVSTAPAEDGGPTATVQGVYLLHRPVALTHGSRLHVAAQFDGLDADITVEVTSLPPLAGSEG